MAERYTLADALYLMSRLRDPQDGCPWDLKQDFDDITHHTLEECYELVDAIRVGDFPHVAEELGDVLFQVVFYCQLGQERQLFSFDSVVDTLVSKLVRRHPHVFPNGDLHQRFGFQPEETDDIKRVWEEIKAEERAEKHLRGVLDDVPLALPALSRAQKLQKRAAGVGLDWPNVAPVLQVIADELDELKQAVATKDQALIAEELGDVMFSLVNFARYMKLDAEQALRRSNEKFKQRVDTMERLAKQCNQSLDELNESQLDELWQAAKAELAATGDK